MKKLTPKKTNVNAMKKSSSNAKNVKKSKNTVKTDKNAKGIEYELSLNLQSNMFSKKEGEKTKREDSDKKSTISAYYKNMVLRCGKCEGEFTHDADIKSEKYELTCPHCSETHLITLKPESHTLMIYSKTTKEKK